MSLVKIPVFPAPNNLACRYVYVSPENKERFDKLQKNGYALMFDMSNEQVPVCALFLKRTNHDSPLFVRFISFMQGVDSDAFREHVEQYLENLPEELLQQDLPIP